MERGTSRFVLVVLSILPVLVSGGAKGQLLGTEFRVNTTTTGGQRNPSVAFDGSGGFVVAWQSGMGAVPRLIFRQPYSTAGTLIVDEFALHTYTSLGSYLPAVASTGSGGFVVVWERYISLSSSEVWARRFDGTGMGIGGEFRVDTATTGYQDYPAVASDA